MANNFSVQTFGSLKLNLMQAIDQIVLNFFISLRAPWLSFIFLVITYSASYVVIIGITTLSALSFFVHKHYLRILTLLVSVLGSAITVFLLKNIFYRTRPLTEALYLESTYSFPSGHAAMAMALYGFIFYTIWTHQSHHLKNPFILFLGILVILIGASRLYLGVHYLSDVLAGYAIGLLWLWISHSISKLKIWLLLDSGHL